MHMLERVYSFRLQQWKDSFADYPNTGEINDGKLVYEYIINNLLPLWMKCTYCKQWRLIPLNRSCDSNFVTSEFVCSKISQVRTQIYVAFEIVDELFIAVLSSFSFCLSMFHVRLRKMRYAIIRSPIVEKQLGLFYSRFFFQRVAIVLQRFKNNTFHLRSPGLLLHSPLTFLCSKFPPSMLGIAPPPLLYEDNQEESNFFIDNQVTCCFKDSPNLDCLSSSHALIILFPASGAPRRVFDGNYPLTPRF